MPASGLNNDVRYVDTFLYNTTRLCQSILKNYLKPQEDEQEILREAFGNDQLPDNDLQSIISSTIVMLMAHSEKWPFVFIKLEKYLDVYLKLSNIRNTTFNQLVLATIEANIVFACSYLASKPFAYLFDRYKAHISTETKYNCLNKIIATKTKGIISTSSHAIINALLLDGTPIFLKACNNQVISATNPENVLLAKHVQYSPEADHEATVRYMTKVSLGQGDTKKAEDIGGAVEVSCNIMNYLEKAYANITPSTLGQASSVVMMQLEKLSKNTEYEPCKSRINQLLNRLWSEGKHEAHYYLMSQTIGHLKNDQLFWQGVRKTLHNQPTSLEQVQHTKEFVSLITPHMPAQYGASLISSADPMVTGAIQEAIAEQVSDQATAANTDNELDADIEESKHIYAIHKSTLPPECTDAEKDHWIVQHAPAAENTEAGAEQGGSKKSALKQLLIRIQDKIQEYWSKLWDLLTSCTPCTNKNNSHYEEHDQPVICHDAEKLTEFVTNPRIQRCKINIGPQI